MRMLLRICLVLMALTPAAAAAQDAPTSVEEWTARAEHGDHAATAHLCDVYFRGLGGAFDPQKAAAWCHAAAEAGDPVGLSRLGLLSLSGVGTNKDIDGAARLCTQAAAHEATEGAAGFCLAAVAKERARTGSPVIAGNTATQPPADPAVGKTIAHWRDLADRGDPAATAHLCETYFDASVGAFEAAHAAEWCRRSAGYGDANAMLRLGLMRFWGVGVERSGPGAESLCVEAHARDAAVSSGFCVAAVKADRAQAEAQFNPSHSAYPQPWPAASELASVPNALGPDRVLETVHGAANGLRFSCRDLIKWSRYGLELDGLMFGQPIAQFDAGDYAALDAGVADCTAAIAPYDQDGSERTHLAAFRQMLPSLRQHQQALARHTAQLGAEKQRQDREDAVRSRDFLLVVAGLSGAQTQCLNAIRRDWLSRRFSPSAHSLEIRSVVTNDVNGNTVVSGEARVIGNQLEEDGSAAAYSCTFDGQSQSITRTSVDPARGSSATALGR
jgi:TPR repeat protein